MARGDRSEEARAFVCPHCEKPATAEVQGTAVWSGYDSHDRPQGPPAEYALVQCKRCGEVAVQVREDYGDGFERDDPVVIFPAPHRLSISIPAPLRREWEEARRCFDAKAYTACVVMVRRTLEGTCKDQGVTKRTLDKSIRELRDQGLIEGTLADWADALRVVGNQGAHFTGRAVAREDAEDALAFTEALLDHLYVLRRRFDVFLQRLADAKGKAS